MPIAGVVVITVPEEADRVLEQLDQRENVTTYGVHKKNNIIAVFEAETVEQLERISTELQNEISGILGIFPAYVNFEDEQEFSG